jgi:hypothetical protein
MGGKASILLVFGFGLVLSYISYNLYSFSSSALGNMTSYYDATASHELALAGANVGVSKVYMDTTWEGPLSESFSSKELNGSFEVSAFDAGPSRKIVRSISSYPSFASGTLHDTVDVYFNTVGSNSLTLYAWMVNNTGNVFWSNGDTVWGRAHANGMVHISGSPVFMDKATTSKRFDPPNVGKGTNLAYFKNGYETGVAPVPMPSDLSQLVAASDAGGKHYANDVEVTLNPGSGGSNDGVAYVKDLVSGLTDTVSLSAAGFNGVILSNKNVRVKGTLDGKLTVTSLKNVVVTDDVLYEQDPRSSTSDDLLGLVAETNILIADNAANNSECNIMGSLLARTGSIVAENLTTRPLPICGGLSTLGSIIQNSEQEVGTYHAGGNMRSNLTHGFYKNFHYDTRLQNPAIRPPFFPGYEVPNYSITNWWESYRVSSPQ